MAGQIPVIGLTGGIGAGKSTVTQLLKELGAAVIDADTVGHQIYLPDLPAWREIVATFGPDVLNADRTINRQALGKIVFADPEALRRLNGIVHRGQLDASGGPGMGGGGVRGGRRRSASQTAESLPRASPHPYRCPTFQR